MADPRVRRSVLGVLLLAVAVAVGLHTFALSEYRGSFPPAPLPAQATAIERAAALEPWNPSFGSRRAYVTAQVLRARGRIGAAYTVLHAAVYAYPTDVALDQLYRRVYREWYAATTGKAHVQHGLEGPGGTLRPEDVQH